MELARLKFGYRVVLPLLLVAIGVVGYYSFQNAAQFARLGEQSIANSTLWLAQNRVDRLEDRIIAADNAVFNAIDLEHPRRMKGPWFEQDKDTIGGVREVAILDSQQRIVAYASRARRSDRGTFRQQLMREIIPDLELSKAVNNRLYHLHRRYGERSYLVSYKAVNYDGTGYFLVAHHDTGYLIRRIFPEVLTSESGKEWMNVVDENNRRIFGQSLSKAGDYVVGHRFPTTLYSWRLQVAPATAPELEAQGRTSRFNQAALIALCLLVIFGAVVFSLYVASQERKLAALKSDFIANVSHELKTPLSVIRMFAEMLSTNRVPDRAKERAYIDIISRESERLSNLIQNVLDFAALERGKQQYEMEVRDMQEVVQRAIDTFRYRLDQLGAQVNLEIGEGPFLCQVDEQSILLCIINLLDNAIKYGEGHVTITVEHGHREVIVGVRDHGPGIPEAELRRVFERFYRSSRRSGVRGSGIGLSLVKHIAIAHRGKAWAENATDGGARILFSVPLAAEQAAARSGAFEPNPSADTVARRG